MVLVNIFLPPLLTIPANMNTTRKRPPPLSEQNSRNKRRSLSTTSRDTSIARNSPVDSDVRYAPINTDAYQQSASRDAATIVTPTESHLSGEHASLAQIRQFNDSYTQLTDPNLKDAPSANQIQEDGGLETSTQQQRAFQARDDQPAPDTTAGPLQPRNLTRTLSHEGLAGNGTDEEKKGRKQANNNAANEKELRDLIEANAERSLESIARDVRSAERTQKAEKAKQLFAMRW